MRLAIAAQITPALINPYLERCGYASGSRLVRDYAFGTRRVPLAGFYGRPFDTRSACLAVVESRGDGRAAAAETIELGAPTAFVCNGQILEWWRLSVHGPEEPRRFSASQLENLFDRHRDELSPDSIYSAKMRRPTGTPRDRQLWFLDLGLMPLAERRNGEQLHHLVGTAIQHLTSRLGRQIERRYAEIYKTVFWLLAAKLLHDKGVENFKKLNLTDVDEVFARVGKHYADIDELPPGGKAWRPAIDEVAATVGNWPDLGNVSTESLAYLYEKALIDRKPKAWVTQKKRESSHDIRKALGIHSTPTVLIDYILAQLWPLIGTLDPEQRHVFEPACGNAGFLVAAMRWLRDYSGMPEGRERHRYLRTHLYGIELDPFASELARLSLTLADVPYGNSWQIETGDMFSPGALSSAAARSTVLLANPPYEPFTAEQRTLYRHTSEPITALTKSTEVLRRTLFHLPTGGVFGFVLPRGVLNDQESKSVREFLLRRCEIIEIGAFADNLFEEADHETVVLLGRRRDDDRTSHVMRYRRVRESGMTRFKERLTFSSEWHVPQARLADSEDSILLVPDLPEVWEYLSDQPRLGDRVHVQQGRQYWAEEELAKRDLLSTKERTGWIAAILRADDDYRIWDLPRRLWLAPARDTFRDRGGGAEPGHAQVIVNYAPVAREPWRLKPAVDEYGHAVSSRFLVFRPRSRDISLRTLWAIMNSPVANAYSYCFAGKTQTLIKEWRDFPLPDISRDRDHSITTAADHYLTIATEAANAFMRVRDDSEIRHALMALDAEVLKLYDLPPRLERQLLDLFTGVERKGVGCDFRGYYPTGLEAYVPLHELLSDEYARSTLGRFREQHRPTESPEILAALLAAADTFAEE